MDYKEYPGRIKVKICLDPKFGEVSFEIEAAKKANVKNKCLFDALREFGIELERSKHIVADMAKSTDTGKFYHLEPIDYIKYGRERRHEIERAHQARFGPAKL